MVAPVLPRPQSHVVDTGRYASTEWYDFFRLLSQLVDAGIVTLAQFDALVARVDALEESGGLDFTISGTQSVRVLGTPAGGVVQLLLAGDTNAPGGSFYYGTNAAGAKGFFPLPIHDTTVPYFIPDGETYTVASNKQALWAMPIELGVGSSLAVDGYLIEVG